MQKVSNIIFKLILLVEFIFRLGLVILGGIIIFLIAYLLGYQYLQGLIGNDTYNALNNIYNIAKWWPRLPIWYTGQGAGVSFLWGYPLLSSIAVNLISLWRKISIVSAFQIYGFLSFPLTALGMYVFVWRRLKNQTAGFIASVFYLLMPATWVWIFDWGFYALSTANIFIFPSLLVYDRFLEGVAKRKIDFYSRICLLLAVLLLGFTFFAHPEVYFVVIRIMGIYSPIYLLWQWRKNFRKLNILLALVPTLVVFILSVLGSLYIVGNYQYYSANTPKLGGSILDEKDNFMYYYTTPMDNFLGLGRIPETDFKYVHRNIVISPLVWMLAIPGIILAFFISSRLVGLAIAGWFSVYLIYDPTVLFYIISHIPFANYLFSMRSDILVVKIMLPIVAAFGLWGIPGVFLKILTFWIRIKNRYFVWFKENTIGIIASIITFGMAAVALLNFSNYPLKMWGEDGVRFGPTSFNLRDPFTQFQLSANCQTASTEKNDFCNSFTPKTARLAGYLSNACGTLKGKSQTPDICQRFMKEDADKRNIYEQFVKQCELGKAKADETALCPLVIEDKSKAVLALLAALRDKNYWPKTNLLSKFDFPYTNLNEFNQTYGNDPFLRIDVAPTLGGVTQTLNMVNQASMINLYTVQLDLMEVYWGYEQQVFFSENDKKIETVNEMAKWYGTKFLLFNPTTDPLTKYEQSDTWKPLYGGKMIWEYSQAPSLWTLTSGKPNILVIGSQKKRIYEPVFKSATKGALPYDEFWLTQGGEYVDAYSLNELKKFDIVMLYGYKYHSRSKAYKNLEAYVKNGGNLYISTGWQFDDADWEIKQAPEVFPVESLTWNDNFSKASRLVSYSDLIGDVDLSGFGDLEWSSKGWGMSIPTNLRNWAKPILEVDGKTIIAGGVLGKGKVVWSGLNLIGHMNTYKYPESEINLMHQLFLWLGKPDVQDYSDTVKPSRPNPDKIVFNFTQDISRPTYFYFREAYFPNWQATLDSKDKKTSLPIYRSGPNFKIVYIPKIKQGDTLYLEIKPGFIQYLNTVVSIGTICVLILFVPFGAKLFSTIYLNKIKRIGKTYLNKVNEGWSKEE